MYIYHYDAGHGWLEVPISEVEESGIEVSGYSYRKGDKAYLEEDLDAPTFMIKKGVTLSDITNEDDGDYSPIRDYASY